MVDSRQSRQNLGCTRRIVLQIVQTGYWSGQVSVGRRGSYGVAIPDPVDSKGLRYVYVGPRVQVL